MNFSEEYLYENFKRCQREAIAANQKGQASLAKSKLNEAAEFMEKLSMAASGEYRGKYAENANRIRALADSIKSTGPNKEGRNAFSDSPQLQSAGGGTDALSVYSADDKSADMSEFFKFLRKDELKFGFDGVVGLDSAKSAVTEYIINPVRYPEAYNYNFLDNQAILLEGPPGTGKTTFARAVAKETGVPFALVNSGALVNCYIGETGKNIDKIFNFLRSYVEENNTKVIIFFDEFDEIAQKRGSDDKTSAAAVPALLRNLDGVASNKNLFVLANTNFVNMLDPAIAERFRRIIHIPLPGSVARKELFKAKLSDVEQEFIDEINFESAAELSEGLSGRDITFICDDFKRVLSKIKAKIIQTQNLNGLLRELIEERQNTKIKSE